MSCVEGSELDCTEVLDQVFEYLNKELSDDSVTRVKGHLDACPHCLQEFGLEDAVRQLVASSCGCEVAPERLRRQIISRITEVRVSASASGASASVTLSSTTEVEPGI